MQLGSNSRRSDDPLLITLFTLSGFWFRALLKSRLFDSSDSDSSLGVRLFV